MISKLLTGTFFKAVLVINAVMVLLPVFFLFNTSLRDSNSFSVNPIELASDPEWSNFTLVWADGEFPIFLKNSLIITLGSLAVILICALGAGFILGRYQFKGNSFIYDHDRNPSPPIFPYIVKLAKANNCYRLY